MSNMYDPEARKRSISLAREWDRYLSELDRDDDDYDAPPPRAPVAESPQPTPENASTMHRYSEASQDAYSDRMRARYGGEW